MLELKESLSEWKSMPSLLQVEDSATSGMSPPSGVRDTYLYFLDRRRVTRSSVADLRTLYATQLQALHSTIEGSAKFVPATPGRHVVAEMGEVCALNPATYRVEHAVHFVLLDDALLMAKRRRKRTGSGGRLVAERCWMLNEIVMQDVKDSAGKKTFVVHDMYPIIRGRGKQCDQAASRERGTRLPHRTCKGQKDTFICFQASFRGIGGPEAEAARRRT